MTEPMQVVPKIEVTETIGTLHGYHNMGLNLYLTPGSSCPYWGSHPRFMYDKVVAGPYDFLYEAGYNAFDDEADYDEQDEEVSLLISLLPYV